MKMVNQTIIMMEIGERVPAVRRCDCPSLLETTRHRIYHRPNHNNKLNRSITIIRNHFLKNIQAELMEERAIKESSPNNDIVYIQIKLNIGTKFCCLHNINPTITKKNT